MNDKDIEKIKKEIDWIKFSMDTDKSDYPLYFNVLLQNVATRLVLFFGILSAINILVTNYFKFLDSLHFILINVCSILVFLIYLKHCEFKEKNIPGGINNIRTEFKMKKYMLKNRYREIGCDLDKIQKEFDELKTII